MTTPTKKYTDHSGRSMVRKSMATTSSPAKRVAAPVPRKATTKASITAKTRAASSPAREGRASGSGVAISAIGVEEGLCLLRL